MFEASLLFDGAGLRSCHREWGCDFLNRFFVLQLTDISYRYRVDSPWVVDGVSFALARGEIFGLLGPNWAGKSTLMALISGLRRPQQGEIRRAPEVEARGGFALVPQDNAFYPMLSCRENLEFFAGVLGLKGGLLRARLEQAVATAGLGQVMDKRAGECSGGLRRRLNLAIGLVGDPQLLLLDEPTTGVDPQSRSFLLDAVMALRRQGKTIIYTSHYMEEVQRVSDRVAIIDHGRLLCCGSLGELLADTEANPKLKLRTRRAPMADERAVLAAECGLEAEDVDGWLTFAVPAQGRFEDVLATVRRLGLETVGLQAGCRNLEDLFLKHTDRSLRD